VPWNAWFGLVSVAVCALSERFRIGERQIFTDPVFLAHAIRYYREHPHARAGIGTQEGHDRLTAVLSTLHVQWRPADSRP
jgi:hypothetical protein